MDGFMTNKKNLQGYKLSQNNNNENKLTREGSCEWHIIVVSTNTYRDAKIRANALGPP